MPIPESQSAGRRIVSLVPSLTETLCALGGRSRLAGCTAFCTRPARLLKDPSVAKVGGTKTVKRDRVLALKPDLILLNMEENTLEDIDYFRSRVKCYVNGVKTLKDGVETIREVGAHIGREEAAHPLVEEALHILKLIRVRAKEKAAQSAKRPRIFYAIWRNPWMTINADTFIHDHLQTCGAENVFGALGPSRYPEVALDQIREAKPDIIWLPSEPYRFTQKHVKEIRKLDMCVARAALLLAARGDARDLQTRAANSKAARSTLRIELVDGDNVCWFGIRQIEGMAYTFQKLWREPL